MRRISSVIIILSIFQYCLAEKKMILIFMRIILRSITVNLGKNTLTSKYADLIVKLPEGHIIFHRASSYLPKWVTKVGKWDFEEIVERSGDGPDVH